MSRWASRGRIGRSGRRVFLSTKMIGGRLTTTRADVEAFLEELNRVDGEPSRPTRQRDTADADLAALGV